MTTLLKLQDVGMSYHTMDGEIPALSHISFSLKEGEFVSLVGPSGCGKSTILNLIAGLLRPETGAITIQDVPLQQAQLPIGYMLQKDHLFEWRTVYENVILGLEIQKKMTPDRLLRVNQLLEDYGLSDFKQARPSQLSGGMRQRAALIRTLALEPALLLLDEPFSALDYQTRLNVSDDIGKIIRREKKTALLVTHDISEAISMSDRVIVLTKAPASVRCEIPIELDIETKTPMTARSAPNFKIYFNKIWKELNQHE
ncbi:MAG: ABC transporter ATP-binding protein [Clostridiales bacterium]|nr:ABC transporter ATP-binding protein [Clostridiales bacterium]